MKLRQLNEDTLLEREINKLDVQDTQFSPKIQQILDVENDYEKAYKEASGSGSGQALFVIYVEYKPTRKQEKSAQKKGGSFQTEGGGEVLKGYLQQKDDKTVKAKKINLASYGDELLDAVDVNGKVVKEGLFNLVPTQEGATPYSDLDAGDIVKKLKARASSGVRIARAERATKKNIGKQGSEKDLVVDRFLSDVLGADGFDKVKQGNYLDLLEQVAVSVKFNEREPLLIFLNKYLKNHNLSRSSYIILHNLYANGRIRSTDLVNSYLTQLLNSDLLEKYSRKEVEDVLEAYKDLYNAYGRFNREQIANIFKSRMRKSNFNEFMEKVDSRGVVSKEAKKTFADTVIYMPNQRGKTVERVVEISNIMTDIMSGVDNQPIETQKPKEEKPASGKEEKPEKENPSKAVKKFNVPDVPDTLEQSAESKFDEVLKDVTQEELPQLFAYLKKKDWIN